VAHICNHSYSGGRDQEDHGLKPGRANSAQDPILKNFSQKRAGGVDQGIGPEFKLQQHTHTKDCTRFKSLLVLSNYFVVIF
jgi:hypothetical protein